MNKQIYNVDLKTNWFHLKRHVKGDVGDIYKLG